MVPSSVSWWNHRHLLQHQARKKRLERAFVIRAPWFAGAFGRIVRVLLLPQVRLGSAGLQSPSPRYSLRKQDTMEIRQEEQAGAPDHPAGHPAIELKQWALSKGQAVLAKIAEQAEW